MSLRQRRRLQEAVRRPDVPTAEPDVDNDAAGEDSQPRRSAFLRLADDSSDDSSDSSGSDDEATGAAAGNVPAGVGIDAPPPSQRRRRSTPVVVVVAAPPPAAVADAADGATASTTTVAATNSAPVSSALFRGGNVGDDDAELLLGAAELAGVDAGAALDELLRPSERHLNADAEVMRILGPGAGAGARAGGAAPAPAARVPQPGGTGRRKTRYATVSPDAAWVAPPTRAAGGYSIALTAAGVYALEPSEEYRAAQAQFEAVVAAHDPGLIAAHLARVPYDVDALLAFSELQRLRGQHEAASASVRQAAFCVESALPHSFRPWDGPCRMDVAPGRDGATGGGASCGRVWWRLMQAAGRAGAPRTAFETCKLLLQCAPPCAAGGDPLRALLALDYYALRAGQARFVVALTGALPGHTGGSDGTHPGRAGLPQPGRARPLLALRGTDVPAAAMPSLLFSRAVALFQLECDGAAAAPGGAGQSGSGSPHSAGHKLQVGPQPAAAGPPAADALHELYADMSFASYGATRCLARALLMFPHALLPLLAELGIRAGDTGVGAAAGAVGGAGRAGGALPATVTPPGDCEWGVLFAHRLFAAPFAEYATIQRRGWTPWGGGDGEDDDEEGGGAAEEGGGPPGGGDETRVRRPAAAARPSDSVKSPSGWTPALEKLTHIYVKRHASLWRNRDRLGWLYTAARAAMAAADAGRDLEAGRDVDGGAEAAVLAAVFPSAEAAAAEAFTAAAARRSLYEPRQRGGGAADVVDENRRAAATAAIAHYAGAVASEFSDELTTIAAELLDEGGGAAPGGDGAAPQGGAAPRPPGIWIGGAGAAQPLNLARQHPAPVAVAIAFFESALPWTVIPGAPSTRDPLRGL